MSNSEMRKLINLVENATNETLDKEDFFHKSVENGKFMTNKAGGSGDSDTLYLHDLDNEGSDKGRPMMVTFASSDKKAAEKAARKFGGKLFKTRFGTFRIIKEENSIQKEEQELDLGKESNDAHTEAAEEIMAYAREKGSAPMYRFAQDLLKLGQAQNQDEFYNIAMPMNKRYKGFNKQVQDEITQFLKKHNLA